MIRCTSCGKDVNPEAFGGKIFCPQCGKEIIEAAPASKPEPVRQASKPASGGQPLTGDEVSIKDGMGIIEQARTKVGAVESFSDNSVTNNTTNHISNITKVEDDTKKSVVCEISGKKVLVTSSVQCPVCGKTVADQYYDEEKLRCMACEKRALADYERFYKELTEGARTIDKEMRSVLDDKAKSYKLTAAQVKEIELKLKKAGSGKTVLSDIKRKDFNRTVNQLLAGNIDVKTCLGKVSAYAKITDDDEVQCWYHLLWAVSSPKEYRTALNEATVDEYWQIYWAFAAAVKVNEMAEAVNAVDVAKEKYPEKINDVTLSQVFLELCQCLVTKDTSYLSDAQNDLYTLYETESPCLEVLKKVCFNPAFIEGMFFKGVLPKQQEQKPQEQTAPSKPVSQPVKPVSQPVSQPQKPQQNTATVKPVMSQAQPQNSASKGVVINNSAGGPLNPGEVSFQTAQKSSKKGGTVIWVLVLLLALAAGAYFFMGGKSDVPEVAEQQNVEEPVAQPASVPAVSQEEEPAQAVVPAVAQEEEPAQAVVPAAPATLAEKKVAQKVQETAAAKAEAEAAAKEAADKPAPAADVCAEAKAAYDAGDFRTAHDLYKKAGNAGNPEACYQLGLMLSTGKGSIAKNALQAKMWMKKAAGLGHKEAEAALAAM
ncbi:MAG: hypothetical protein IJN02_02305 [Bacteroidales bacterium]|nr:hypothetical protein [Bacteroidales bacterium]